MSKIPAVSKLAAMSQAKLYSVADYGYECDADAIRWYVIIYMV